MFDSLLPYIQVNKEYNKDFSYTFDATLHPNSIYAPENALVYNSINTRYSSDGSTDADYWSICFKRKIFIVNYTFTEPNYEPSNDNCHQKSWNFYGSKKQNEWILIDEKRNMIEHNQANYRGSYQVRNFGPFSCFKIQNVESFSKYKNSLTFRQFDILYSTSLFCTHIQNYHIQLRTMSYVLFISFK